MNIVLKLDIGDTCYFVSEDYIQKGKVKHIGIKKTKHDIQINYIVEFEDFETSELLEKTFHKDWVYPTLTDMIEHANKVLKEF
jgi:hypothetical protein